MDWSESVKMSVQTLTGNKLRSALTMLGMIIGNASVITMIGIGQGAQRLASEQFESLGPNVLFVTPGSQQARQRSTSFPRTLVWNDAKAIISQVPTVSGVAPSRQSQLQVVYGNTNKSTLVIGTTPEFLPVRDFAMSQGRFVTDADVVGSKRVAVIGADILNTFFGGRNPR
jgi:putative ABC transport system permease protein